MRGLSQPTTCDEYEAGNVGGSEDDVVSFEDEDEAVNNPTLDEEIPTHIDPIDVDDDGNPTITYGARFIRMAGFRQEIQMA